MRILVTGARGMLGSDLVPILQDEGHQVLAWDLEELDITRRNDVFKALETAHPQAVVNCAAYTDVDGAETEREKAYAINALGVQNLALACAKIDCEMMQISTDYVFDGTKRTPYLPLDQPAPINWYGYTKYAGEKFVQWHCSRFYILRTSWLYGKHGKNFVKTILRLAEERDHLEVVDDQVGAPTNSIGLAHAITKVINGKSYGIHHFTDNAENGISWWDFAVEIAHLAGTQILILKSSSNRLTGAAKRPAYSVLACTMANQDWKDQLTHFILELP